MILLLMCEGCRTLCLQQLSPIPAPPVVAVASPEVNASETALSKAGIDFKELLKSLQLRHRGNLKKNVTTLVEWGMGKSDVERVLKAKSNFTVLAPATVEKKLEFLIEKFDLDREGMMKVIRRYPAFLALSMEGNVQPHLNSFLSEATKSDVKKMILRFPNIIGYGKKYGEMEKFFWETIGVSEQDFRRMVLRFPALLGYSMESNLKAKLDRFRSLGLNRAELVKVVTDCPSLLGRDFEKTIKSKIEWLKLSFGFQEREVVDELKRIPAKFICALSTWEDTHVFLKSMDMTYEEIQAMLHAHFKILSEKNFRLEERADFARSVLNKSNQEITSCPEYLTTSLHRVVLCRIGILHHFGETPQEFPLSHLFGDKLTKKTEKHDEQEIQSFVDKFHDIPISSRKSFIREMLS